MATSSSPSTSIEDFEDLYQDYAKGLNATEDGDKIIYKPQFEDVTQLYSQYGGLGDVFKTSEKQNRSNDRGHLSDKKFGDVTLLLRRKYNHHLGVPGSDQWTMALELQSPVLQQSFKEIVKGCTSISLEQSPIVLPEPFAELYFCQEKIRDAIQTSESDEVKSALQLLESFRQSYMKKTIAGLESARSEGLIEASNLWSLFPIGSTIVLENRVALRKSLIWCVIVRECSKKEQDNPDKEETWTISVEFNSFNGKRFIPVERSFDIGGFKGPRLIRLLPAYPLSLHPQKDKLRQSLIDRGKKYVELATNTGKEGTPRGKGSHQSYCGPFWNKGDDFYSKPIRPHDGRVVVDPAGILEEDAGFCDTISNTNEHRFDHLHRNLLAYPTLGQNEVLVVDSDTDDQPDLGDDDLLTLPATIPAYSLSFKKWGLVDVEHIEPIQWQNDIYDMLQMENTQKDMVRNIIDSHHASSTAFDDFIPGKGRGLVFLLHGPPGCGKTLTAESAAESLHRPLYYISGAELGMLHDIHAGSMEDKLELIFKRIARWEAILLFDEAESFVASRQSESHNAQKNALTSVLLRMLEYQSGIIFLTTNRVSDFDTALFSRVHITLAFEALTSTHCRFIWKKLAAQTDHDITEDDFDRLSQIPLDGRTIKNVLRVASLQTKIRERQNEGVPAKMNMADVKAVFPYAVGASENTEIGQKMKVLYAS